MGNAFTRRPLSTSANQTAARRAGAVAAVPHADVRVRSAVYTFNALPPWRSDTPIPCHDPPPRPLGDTCIPCDDRTNHTY